MDLAPEAESEATTKWLTDIAKKDPPSEKAKLLKLTSRLEKGTFSRLIITT